MASSFENYNKRRLISSYFSVVLSIFLVLFLLGALGLFVINSKKITNDFKENIPMTVFFDNDAKDSTISAFDTELKNAKWHFLQPRNTFETLPPACTMPTSGQGVHACLSSGVPR